MTVARVTHVEVEVLIQGMPKALITHEFAEILTTGTPNSRTTQFVVEVLCKVGTTGPPTSIQQPVVVIIT